MMSNIHNSTRDPPELTGRLYRNAQGVQRTFSKSPKHIGTFRITTYDGSLKKSNYAQALPETR